MKNLALIVTLCIVATTSFAQHPLSKGQTAINAGFGFSSWGIPVYVGFDHGVSTDVTLGAEASFRLADDNFENTKYGQTIIGISGNVNYHFNSLFKISKDWDLYAGLNIGFYIVNNEGGYKGDRTSGLNLGGQIGGRYYFSNTVGLNLEFGGGNRFSNGKIGLSFKL